MFNKLELNITYLDLETSTSSIISPLCQNFVDCSKGEMAESQRGVAEAKQWQGVNCPHLTSVPPPLPKKRKRLLFLILLAPGGAPAKASRTFVRIFPISFILG